MMKKNKFNTTIADLISAIDTELLDYKFHNKTLRNKLVSIILSDILQGSRIIRSGTSF